MVMKAVLTQSTIRNGNTKNSSSQTNGMAITSVRPRMPRLASTVCSQPEAGRRLARPTVSVEAILSSAQQRNGAVVMPGDGNPVVPIDHEFGGTHLVRHGDLDLFAAVELHQVDRQVAHVGYALDHALDAVVALPQILLGEMDLLGPDGDPGLGARRAGDAVVDIDVAACFVGSDQHMIGLVLDQVSLKQV